MTTTRLLLAGLLATLAMFAWVFLAHAVLPLGQTGIQMIPSEQDLLGSLHAKLGNTPGLYMFPGMSSPNASMADYEKALAANPSGMLIYSPPGEKAITPGQLIIEFLTDLVEALLAAWLLAQTRLTTYLSRVAFVAVAGIFAAIATNVPYWNWFHFPGNYTAASVAIEIVGFLVGGLVLAKMVRPAATAA